MATARPQIRVGFPPRERVRHKIATISDRRSRPETGAAEFDRARGWLGLPRVSGEMAMAKYVCDDIIGEVGKTARTILGCVGGKFLGSSTEKRVKCFDIEKGVFLLDYWYNLGPNIWEP